MDLRDYFKSIINWGLYEDIDTCDMMSDPEKYLEPYFNSLNMGKIYDTYYPQLVEIIEVEELKVDANNYKQAVLAGWEWIFYGLLTACL
jgi:hypothetical protein